MSRNERSDDRIREAIRMHGDDCVGLRLGIRAVEIVVRELAILEDTKRLNVRLGTKQCLGDAFKALLHLEDNQVEYAERDDTIHVTNGTSRVELHLTQKKLMDANDVMNAFEAELFPVIKKSSN